MKNSTAPLTHEKLTSSQPVARIAFRKRVEAEISELPPRHLGVKKNSLKVRLSNRFIIFLLRKGLDLKSSAKEIRTELEELLVSPLSRLVGSGQLTCGDVLMIRTKAKNGEIQIERISGRQRQTALASDSSEIK